MRGAYWISGGALQKGKKATEPSVQFDNRFLWIAGFSFCIGVVCGACMLDSDFPLFLVVSLTETSAGLAILQIQWGLGSERQERVN